MAYKKSISETLKEIAKIKSTEEKVEALQKNNSTALRNILILMYDKSKEFYVPESAPPYEPSPHLDNQGALYRDWKKLSYIVKGFSDPNIHKIKREHIFIEMLESIDKEDAELLCQMIERKKIKGITAKHINSAFGLQIAS